MSLASPHFAVFLGVLLLAYWGCSERARKFLLLLASYGFYACWEWRFLGLLLASTVVDHSVGARLPSAIGRERRLLLFLSVGVNLAILGLFKYAGFFAASAANLAGVFGWRLSPTILRVGLPVGISFYTFRSLSYTIDVYRGRIPPGTRFLDYALFMAFFPLLGAGPIVRARQFLPQLQCSRRLTPRDVEFGLSRFLLGLSKKILIADVLGPSLVDPVFAQPAGYRVGIVWLALVGYAIQIYADFSGYSSMAIGVSRLLGFRIGENFSFPYLATSPADFWRRWHISLTSWFREYLWWPIAQAIPVSDTARGARALVLVFLLSGLWHGAAWTFVAWGGLHGVYLAAQQWWRSRPGDHQQEGGAGARRILAGIATFASVALAWVLFRAPDFPHAFTFLSALVGPGGQLHPAIQPSLALAFGGFVVDHAAGCVVERRPKLPAGLSPALRGLGYATLVILIWNGAPHGGEQFIYFQF